MMMMMTRNLYKGMKEPLMTAESFETMRLGLVSLTILYRLLIMPRYLQAYLNIAYDKVTRLFLSLGTITKPVCEQVAELKQEAGKISNLDLQRKVVRVFYYLCVVTLQYTAPMILILYLSFLYKTLGGGSWTGGLVQGPGAGQEAVKEAGDEFQEVQVDTEDMDIGIGSVINQEESVEAIKHQFSLAWNSVKNVSHFSL